MTRRAPALLAGATCLAWLALTTGYGAAAAGPGVDLGGEPLPEAASTDGAHPTALAPGLWRSTLSPSYPQFFSYERRINGSRVHVGVLGAPQGDSSDAIEVEAGVASEDSSSLTSCGDETDNADSSIPQAVIGASVVAGDAAASDADPCRDAGTVQIEVSRGSGSATTDLPYVIKVVEEAPSSGTGDEEPEDQPAYDLPAPREAEKRKGAASFADAPELDPGDEPVTVRTTITEGTEQLWRVPVGWGEQLVARADVPYATDDAFDYGGPSLALHLVDPLGERHGYADSASDDSDSGSYRTEGDDSEPTVLVAAGHPVREVDDRVPGDHWVALAVSPPPDDRAKKPAAIPVEVTVAVTRDPGTDHAPEYDGVAVSQDKGTTLEGYSPQHPFLVGEDTYAAVASGGAAGADGWLTTRRWAGLGIAVASLACLGAGLVRLRSGGQPSRSTSATSSPTTPAASSR
ncbi:hypothetical protein FHP29_13390 [Nocardioides albidus]|uniref:DUF3068 domain-containing protein n=1 Tax=Nocardioides albidus TaxID=1517589 RepID=A0A5C4VQQ6_9ACTN|nr:hypothetical protein [Nocardioides albidus]TNM38274.1 hypothetical protein FHP29_13390 [Nocardioides albidus]